MASIRRRQDSVERLKQWVEGREFPDSVERDFEDVLYLASNAATLRDDAGTLYKDVQKMLKSIPLLCMGMNLDEVSKFRVILREWHDQFGEDAEPKFQEVFKKMDEAAESMLR